MQDGKSRAHGVAPGQQLGEDEVAVLDDATHFRRICAQLEACPGLQANEAELKVRARPLASGCCRGTHPTLPSPPLLSPPLPPTQVVLGLRGTRGHRLWRRLKPALAKRGNIEEFLARSADDKPVK